MHDIVDYIYNGNLEKTKELIGEDLNLNRFNRGDINILHEVCNVPLNEEYGHFNLDVLKYICEINDLDINSISNSGYTGVYNCSKNGNVEALTYLCELGADVNIADNRGVKPLGALMVMNPEGKECAKTLLRFGADPDCVCNRYGKNFRQVIEQKIKRFVKPDEDDIEFFNEPGRTSAEQHLKDFTELDEILSTIPINSRSEKATLSEEAFNDVVSTWDFDEIWKRFVPRQGQAETKQGEMARIVGMVYGEFRRNGNINWEDTDRFKDQAMWLNEQLRDESVFNSSEITEINEAFAMIIDNGKTGRLPHKNPVEYNLMEAKTVQWIKANPDPIKNEKIWP